MDPEHRMRPVRIRRRAIGDIEQHAEYLGYHAPPDVAIRFRSAVLTAIDQIAFMPSAGSPVSVQNPRLRGLRMKVVPGFGNYLMFYLTPDGDVNIIRVFHGAQDTLTILEDEELE